MRIKEPKPWPLMSGPGPGLGPASKVLDSWSWIPGLDLDIRCDNYCKAGADDITKSINILNAINILKFERGSKFFCKMQN